uniref:TSA: Wollemia nobilis Ref_Wollemi_Transcript_17198_659 transcribed RNA sequence n=1 Tax=Wollemia nobilis TaxID=56998 RepID=A0A0C9RIE7_9CONI
MGFPAGYYTLHVSNFVVVSLRLLAYVKNAIWCLLSWLRLIEQLQSETFSWQDFSEISSEFSSVSAGVIRERLPVVDFRSFAERGCRIDEDAMCAVCLSSFKEEDEIRELCNCCHIFHRNCLDKWIDLDQKTCPLCRSPLLPERERVAAEEGQSEVWIVDRISYLFGEDLIASS